MIFNIRKKKKSPEYRKYITLMRERPEDFKNDGDLLIIKDLEEICRFEKKSGRVIGVVYDSPYSMMVVDLVKSADGKLFAYERRFPKVKNGAVVTVTECDGKFILLEQYRHALRGTQVAFPRGFGELGLSSRENAVKEIEEETGGKTVEAVYIGSIVSDSGYSTAAVDVYYCKIKDPITRKGYEGIKKLFRYTPEELSEKIRKGEITDGFTLAAFELYREYSSK